jgi:hypothetical protein
MADRQIPETYSINGLVLQFYLNLITNSTEAFKSKDAEIYFLHTYHLRSLITDENYLKAIDVAIKKVRDGFVDMKGADGRPLDSKMKSFLEGFCVVNNCMKFLDYTMKITKRDVEINADQSDERMPEVAFSDAETVPGSV